MTLRVADNTLSDFVFIIAGLVTSIQHITLSAVAPDVSEIYAVSSLTYFFYVLVNVYQAGLQLWFWTAGYKSLQNIRACGPTDFWLFTRFKAYGGFRIAMIVVHCVGFGPMILQLRLVLSLNDSLRNILQTVPQDRLPRIYIHRDAYVYFSYLVALSLLVASAEMTIRVNGITGIRDTFSTGQLLALLLGIMTCVRSLWHLALAVGGEAILQRTKKRIGRALGFSPPPNTKQTDVAVTSLPLGLGSASRSHPTERNGSAVGDGKAASHSGPSLHSGPGIVVVGVSDQPASGERMAGSAAGDA